MFFINSLKLSLFVLPYIGRHILHIYIYIYSPLKYLHPLPPSICKHTLQMLLCDECDRECHTYCQYPRLWRVPRGKWCCPICKEVRKSGKNLILSVIDQMLLFASCPPPLVPVIRKQAVMVANRARTKYWGRLSSTCWYTSLSFV